MGTETVTGTWTVMGKGTEREWERGWKRTKELRTGTGTGVGTRRRTPDGNGDGNGDGSEDSSGDGNGDDDNGSGNENRIGEGGIEAKKRARNRKIVVDAVRETGGTRVEREKNVGEKGLVQELPTQII